MVDLLVKMVLLLFVVPYNIEGCKEQVHVHNNLPPNSPQLQLHCASGDDDLGHNFPKVGADFHWSFCYTPRTLFFCHFWWNGKDLAFDVYNNGDHCVDGGTGFVPSFTSQCHWQVQSDGFYLGYYDQDSRQLVFKKFHNW
ncbi:unnamed protein product [Withania somnifera]